MNPDDVGAVANRDTPSCLERLVAGLLHKDQILRFEFFHAQEQLERKGSNL